MTNRQYRKTQARARAWAKLGINVRDTIGNTHIPSNWGVINECYQALSTNNISRAFVKSWLKSRLGDGLSVL